MKILFLHGWQSVPGGVKPTYLAQHGHTVINPKLPNEDFAEAVRIAQAEFDKQKPDVVVGSSRGGAIAMNIDSGNARLVLLCPAWKKWGSVKKVKLGTVILHSRADDVVPFADSEELAMTGKATLIEIGCDHRLADPEPLEAMLRACVHAWPQTSPNKPRTKRSLWMIRCAILLAAFFTMSLNGFAQEKKGPLADLPSKPGAHIEKIKAMGDNEWLNLGVPAADPKWGKARGSSWGAKALILAPDKRGAFLYGEGVHGYVKPDGHVMDDLWFYDINKHAWLCLYPGTNTKTLTQRVKDKQLSIDDNGQLIDSDKQPVPLHPLVHAWGYLAYDSDRKKFAFLSWSGEPIPRYFLGGEKLMDEGLKLLEEQMKGKKKSVFSPWFYDVASGRFERSPANNSMTIGAGGFPQFHYLPSKKHFCSVGSNTVAIFDPDKNQWSDAKPKGPSPKGYDACGCYDSNRGRIYRNDGDASKGEGLMAYDIEKNVWSHLKPTGTAPEPANTNAAFYEYDARLDLVVALHFRGKKTGIYVYDPKSNSWADPMPFPANGPKFQYAANTIFDRELNAYFCHVAGDSSDNGVMWVYRYKK